ncbi:hypothetical protein ACIBCA_16925 [Kitasatospora sp. NPDC051170]|uniref:hypothetical protein n=1 Tax=Kitasatospora sp. NPDC051170 TaxID=3364056 RepID=UPI0037952C55
MHAQEPARQSDHETRRSPRTRAAALPPGLALQRTVGNTAAVEMLERERRRPAAGAGLAVQRVIDPAVIQGEQEAQGIAGPVKIVEVPDGVTAGTPFRAYPAGHCLNLTDADLNLSVQALNGGQADEMAADAVALAGGGGYLSEHRIILVNSRPEGGFTALQTIQHEMGHLLQHEQGFSVDMSGGRRALVEYHNMLVNENPRTGGMRTEYTSADNSIVSAVRDRATAAGVTGLNQPWKALVAYLETNDQDGSQRRLLEAIEQELAKDDYSEIEGRGLNKAQRRTKIRDRIGRMYFNNLFPQ